MDVVVLEEAEMEVEELVEEEVVVVMVEEEEGKVELEL